MSIPWPSKNDNKAKQEDTHDLRDGFKTLFHSLPPSILILVAFGLGSATAMSVVMVYKRYGRRIRNSDWITPKQLTRKRWLKGVVTSVADGDNFRFFHTPSLGGYTWPFKFRRIPTVSKELKDETLHIRIAGVDAPETAHFGKPAQPYAAESLAWLREHILGKTIYCQPLKKDQYARVVAHVYLSPRLLPGLLFHGKNVSTEMMKAGWAVTYEQAGAEYGKLGKEGYLKLEANARGSRQGMWKSGVNLESPSAYKKRHAATSLEGAGPTKPRPPITRQKPKSLWRRLFSE